MASNDIVLLLYRIKVNIRKVEAGNREVLDEITEDYLQLMELLKLFLISERDTYYGYFLMNMTFRVDYKSDAIAGIVLNQYPPVFAANPLLYCKFSLKEMIFIACHEIEHIILNHPAEMIKSNPTKNPDIYQRFNYAADASVNDRLIYDIKRYRLNYMSFPNGCIDSPTFASVFKLNNVQSNQSYQYYFDLIKKTVDPDFDSMQMAFQHASQNDEGQSGEGAEGFLSGDSDEAKQSEQAGTGQGLQESADSENEKQSSQSGRSDKEERKENEEKKEGSNGEQSDDIVTANNCKNPSTHGWDTTDDAEAAQELAKELVNEAVNMMSEETRGLMPGGFMAQVKKLNEKPQIRWEQVLKKYVGTITAGYRKTRTRLNRRQPERFDLSGKMEEKTLKIVVAIDTSGSVRDEQISSIFNEIFEILSKKKFEMTIIECDARIQRVYKARRREEVQTSVRGRGGTAFTPVIEYINNDKYFRDALLIYFTDGYGESHIPKPRTYRNMWVVLGDEKNLSLREPYGVAIKM